MARDDRDLRDHLYQPGQVIAERGRPVRHVHVIVEGEVELIGRNGEVDPARTLKAGDHFGRQWIESVGVDALRASTLVRTVALRADQAHRLRDVLRSTGRLARDEESLAREAARRDTNGYGTPHRTRSAPVGSPACRNGSYRSACTASSTS